VASLGREIGPIALTAIAAPMTLFLAFLSWTYIEKPALSLREMIQVRLPNSRAERQTEAAV
jgi:peptidoglycan/LPS O-acetylase OafA/YrhL